MSNLSLLTVHKCTIMIRKDIFMGLQLTVFENKRAFIKKAVLHTTTLMHYKARHVLHNLFSADQGNGSYMTFAAGATKINLKNLKT